MNQEPWFKFFPGAITVTDQNGVIVDMNDQSAANFAEEGGYALLGSNVLDCHPEPARTKVKALYDSHEPNVYSIQKQGQKRLIYQTPYFVAGEFSGLIEMSIDLPEDIPHFNRDVA